MNCPQTVRQYPDIYFESDSDSDELTYMDEWLKNLRAIKHKVSTVQPSPGWLATFDIILLSNEPVTALFNTGATCSCISFSLYNQISNKTQMVEMQLQVGQVNGTSLCYMGTVKVTLEINKKQFDTCSSCVKTLSIHFCLAWISLIIMNRYWLGPWWCFLPEI